MPAARKVPPKLLTSAFAYLLVGATVLAAGLAAILPQYARVASDQALGQSVQTRTESAALEFARLLHSDWEELRFVADAMPTGPQEELRAVLNGIVGSGTRISWVGYTALDGTVATSSGGLLEGADVSTRPWFAAGLRGPFAGDLHDAVLLSNLLGGTDDDPLRFIDFALPVRDGNGDVIGVLGSHTTFDWVEQFLTESATVRGLDLYLVNAEGAVIFTTDPALTDPRDVPSLRAAATGIAAQMQETWPDGMDYFTATIPTVRYADLPSFGWRLVGRVPADAYAADIRTMQGTLTAIAIGAGLAFAVYVALFAFIYLRPLVRLVDSAENIASGDHVYPPESRSSAEALRLSGALARIQSLLYQQTSGKPSDRR